ncbi:MAG: DUF1948 domain-containing protein [Mycoplasmataceae bacterium]|nr:DUF1948 domain-containing protein [Mycoplasmataceae bacterium]
MEEKLIWKKRVDVFRYVYECLVNNFNEEEIIKKNIFSDEYCVAIVKYFASNHIQITNEIKNLIDSSTWSWERTKTIVKAIIIAAYCEFKTSNLDKGIIIDQAILNGKYYGEKNDYKFINAILDKILH